MKRKRLSRDVWGFENAKFPYYQFRMDNDYFHGMVGLIRQNSGEHCHWNFPIAGKAPVCGCGMTWLQLIPDNTHRVITAMIKPQPKQIGGAEYPCSISVWYVDIIEAVEYDADGVAVFIDKYLDVIFTPQGDIKIDDRDELEEAYCSGELSDEQYRAAIREGEEIVSELCSDIPATERLHMKILTCVEKRIANGEKPLINKLS